jgi:hypothetical protein
MALLVQHIGLAVMSCALLAEEIKTKPRNEATKNAGEPHAEVCPARQLAVHQDRLGSQAVELIIRLDAAYKRSPILDGTVEYAAVRLHGVAHQDHVTLPGNLDAFVGCAEAGSAPGRLHCLPDLVW